MRRACAAWAALAACGSASVPLATPPPPAPVDETRIAVEPAFAAPSWEPTVISSGTRMAIVGYASGAFVAVDRDAGIVGVLPRGMTTFFVDGHDAVYAVRSGQMARAPTVATALEGRFEPVAMPAAGTCRATLGIIACADDTVLRVSVDEGEHHTEASLPDRRPILDLWPRADGVVVARAVDGTFVSFDQGKLFSGLPGFEPRRADGPWIWNGDPTCPLVLGRDGRAVVRASEVEARAVLARRSFGADARLGRLAAALAARGGGLPPTPLEPSLPRGRPDPAEADPCVGPPPPPPPPPKARVADAAGCSGAACARAESLPVIWGRHALAFFGDGICSYGDSRCTRWVRTPHVAVVDNAERTLAVVGLPDGCNPVRLDSAFGVSVLLCADGEATRVQLGDAAGRFTKDGKLDVAAGRIWHLSVAAEDGTLLLHETCRDGEPCRAWLRRPAPPGERDAWRRLSVPDVVAYRVLSGGRALAMSKDGWLVIGEDDELSPGRAPDAPGGPEVASEVDPAAF